MRGKNFSILLFVFLWLPVWLGAEGRSELYKTMLVRAAPGQLLALIQLYEQHMNFYDQAGDARPFWMRHSQGDQWDLLFLFPMGSFADYFAPQRIQKRSQAWASRGETAEGFADRFYQLVAWHEDTYVEGPPVEKVRAAFQRGRFYHVEMFRSLPGKQKQLYRQREMENNYLEELGRPQNLIFTHEQGGAWDLFTIGFYRHLAHFAESGAIAQEKEDRAARKAGFESAGQIGPYLRTLIAEHHDTLAVAIP
ncbi:MAG: hypothetical protein ACE5JX_05890 [Acidobacteriota bacterium]